MNLSATPTPRPSLKRPSFVPGKPSKWYLPAVAVIALGFGISNYNNTQRYETQQDEAKRQRRNQQLMDAYGDKDTVHDMERALEVYEVQ
ncbi:hypothetical protein EYZ11_009064 [Aspergillus tanneri]|uniref:Uncharacterized protein n=1 Tax=Aspergillus tanneri TaxID=1220188 RepID=A0A4S3JEC7_9EURO|nr:uncharacterized protein ATNIH1004_010125 [Aspergillus tanneri]KAA8643357.1 hypothetical protein ATNIH1004_010125 [Aspergillus tanneri]THC91481.1 hypothetical protein EYZ11_009064 [Aspergillus tanneri]